MSLNSGNIYYKIRELVKFSNLVLEKALINKKNLKIPALNFN